MSEEINNDRRRFLGTAMMTAVAAARLGVTGFSNTRVSQLPAEEGIMTAQSRRTSFDSLKQIDAGLLNVGYAEAGPANGPAVVLLHGWPYDIHSYVDVAPLLADRGYRVIVPYLRGYGTTRFLSDDTVRNGEQAVMASTLSR
jgi:alpha-beta hydrolase superfamily lysophospholipase